MAAPGPKPKPTNLRLLGGGRPTGNPNEPQPRIPTEEPKCPTYLKGMARAEWKRVIVDLYATGSFTEQDESMLAAYCSAFARWRQAEDDLAKMAALDTATHGAMIMTTNGNAIQNPLLGVVSSSRRDMQRLAAEFGLTPSSRTTIAGKKQDDDPTARKYGIG